MRAAKTVVVMVRGCVLIVVVVALTASAVSTVSDAAAQTTVVVPPAPTVERAVRWTRPAGRRRAVSRRVRRVRVSVLPPACARLSRVARKRSRRFVDVTVFYDVAQPVTLPDFPYYAPLSCPPPSRVTRTVRLKERLGARAVRDASARPPRVRYRARR